MINIEVLSEVLRWIVKKRDINKKHGKVSYAQKMITALIGAPSEKIQAYNEVGYYYQCYASSSLYKYIQIQNCV